MVRLGGGNLSFGTLELTGGTVLGNPLDLGADGNLIGHGSILANLSGGTDSSITATGGLLLGNLAANGGFDFDGTLQVGGQQVVLLSANTATLGAMTTLAAGGRLNAPNGANLSAGRVLSASGSALIDGDFTNNGQVNGPAGAGEFLSFNDNVNGAGNYSGNIEFLQGFSPGNSPAVIELDDVTFGSAATLTIELGGLLAGEFDRLELTGNAHLGGVLMVDLLNSFTPSPGDAFEILNVAGTLSGQFAGLGEGALVGNFGGADLFITYAAGDGNDVALFTAVPEPSGVLLFALGTFGLAVSIRRKRV